jgi:predicted short-subunit dehydrogenase-like oxidoreductase (DUF2520 family)
MRGVSPRPASPLRDLRVTILGQGQAGRAFAAVLRSRGARVRTWTRASRANLALLAADSDLVLFCVRDAAIGTVAAALARAWRKARGDGSDAAPVALHVSGFHGYEPLRFLARSGFATGSIHPLVPLKGRASAGDLVGAWFATRCHGRARTLARRLVRGLNGRELRLETGHGALRDDSKHAWHLACALVANGAVSLFDLALEHAGEKAAPALAGMLATVATRLARGPRAALSGPTARGEKEVVAGHLALLGGKPDDEALYRLLSRRLLALSDLPPARRRAMARLLR